MFLKKRNTFIEQILYKQQLFFIIRKKYFFLTTPFFDRRAFYVKLTWPY